MKRAGETFSADELKDLEEDFLKTYQGYYPSCHFTAAVAAEMEMVAAAVGKEQPGSYLFRSLDGSAWEPAEFIIKNENLVYEPVKAAVLDMAYDSDDRQIYLFCDDGSVIAMPDCPKCMKRQRIADEPLVRGWIAENDSLGAVTASGKELRIEKRGVRQYRITLPYALGRLHQGGYAVDLREERERREQPMGHAVICLAEEELEEWLKGIEKDVFLVFFCKYGVQADRAAAFARRMGYGNAYTLGGMVFWNLQ